MAAAASRWPGCVDVANRIMKNLTVVHPGSVLLHDFLKPLRLSQSALARATGIPVRRINEFVTGKRCLSRRHIVLLASQLGTSTLFWRERQRNYEQGNAQARPSA